jgi:hypothetical protein
MQWTVGCLSSALQPMKRAIDELLLLKPTGVASAECQLVSHKGDDGVVTREEQAREQAAAAPLCGWLLASVALRMVGRSARGRLCSCYRQSGPSPPPPRPPPRSCNCLFVVSRRMHAVHVQRSAAGQVAMAAGLLLLSFDPVFTNRTGFPKAALGTTVANVGLAARSCTHGMLWILASLVVAWH